MMQKIYLLVIGLAYLALSAWCMISPDGTAQAVGFDLQPGSGQSEYLVVYGGLQLGLGCFFLWPVIWKPAALSVAIVASLLIHAGIVLLRSISLGLYGDLGVTTLVLAAVEWVILLAAAMLCWRDTAGN